MKAYLAIIAYLTLSFLLGFFLGAWYEYKYHDLKESDDDHLDGHP